MKRKLLCSVTVVLLGQTSMMDAVAQPTVTDLQNPVAISVHRGSGHTFIVEAGTGRLLRWDGEQREVLVEDLRSAPANLDKIVAMTFRAGNKITILGTHDTPNHLRFATYQVVLENPVTFVDTQSGDLQLKADEQFSAFASTDVALYLATKSKSESNLYRLEPTRAKNEKLKPIFTDLSATVTSLSVNQRGHVVAAVSETDRPAQLRFHHGISGKQLLLVSTDARDVNSLSYSNSGRLYAACSKSDRRGIFRFDAFLEGGRQQARAIEIELFENVAGIACADEQVGLALLGGEKDGQVMKLKLD